MIQRIAKDMKAYWGAGAAIVLFYFGLHYFYDAFCPVILITGFPCAGCGITRGLLFLITGRWSMAWNANPVVFPLAACAVYSFIYRYVLGKKIKGLKWMIIVLTLLLVGQYIIRMYLYFPNRPPMVYTTGSLMERFLPGYKEFISRLW